MGNSNVKENEDDLKRVRSLRELRLLLAQDEEGFERLVVPHLSFGDVWFIPDEATGFGEKVHHPWVIVQAFSPHHPSVVACPRTTLINQRHRGLFTPVAVVEGLDREGIILLRHRRSFIAKDFRRFTYLGRLPDHWCQAIRDFYQS
jgi:hypothetical protein